MKVGDRVRSFDFATPGKPWGRDLKGDRASYVEGVIVDYDIPRDGCLRAKILVDFDMFGGIERSGRVGDYVYPPSNGVGFGYGEAKTDFIELLEVTI